MYALQRLLGRVRSAEQFGNRENTMKYIQSRPWLISCITHFNGNRLGERQRIKEILEETLASMSEDENSPTHGDTEEIQKFRRCAAAEHWRWTCMKQLWKSTNSWDKLSEKETERLTRVTAIQLLRQNLRNSGGTRTQINVKSQSQTCGPPSTTVHQIIEESQTKVDSWNSREVW